MNRSGRQNASDLEDVMAVYDIHFSWSEGMTNGLFCSDRFPSFSCACPHV